ncbi:MAG: hypothetical protein GXP54_10035 [Deltaproteobacteria bacterium]|nr:hypothetical protein [Deltaproteobacteria bacterium]
MSGRATARAVAVGVLVTASLAYLAWDVVLAVRVPGEGAWETAAETVRRGYKEGDCVVFDPPWAQEGAPLFDGLDVITTETVDWYEVGKRARVWIVSSPGGDGAIPAGFKRIERKDEGGMGVSLYRAPVRGKLLFSFLDGLGKARVSRVYKDRTERCTNFRNDRWYCGGVHAWRFVGRYVRDIAGAEREMIWAHPMENGVRTLVNFPAVPRGGTLVIHFGLTQRAIETGAGAPVTFVVDVDRKQVFRRVLGVREEGWFEQSVKVPGRGSAVDVTFSVSTPDNKDRQFCFTADMWE